MMTSGTSAKIFGIFLTLAVVFGLFRGNAAGQLTIDELKRNIEQKNSQIEQINLEIKQLDSQIQTTTQEGQTLKSTIATLETSRNKLLKEIQGAQNKVNVANLTIEQLGIEISAKEEKIKMSKSALANAVRDMNRAENFSLAETLLVYDNVSELWNEIETLNRFQVGVKENIGEVERLKKQLADKKTENESQKKGLISLRSELEDKKSIVELNKFKKARLLSETQNKETAFKKQLAEKKRLSEAFLQDLSAYENQLRFIIDPSSYPSSGRGVLRWPLENIFVTQNFGDTDFARNNNAYNGKGHNGVDFRASLGTKIMSASDGVVEGIGNTDIVPGCYSYGKWVLVKHDNGLSTLYAHLDLIKVGPGERVSVGEILGYSGNTGYSTGPHLHFGVYASQGVKIVKYTNSINCKNAIIPVADIRAYLNPLLYL